MGRKKMEIFEKCEKADELWPEDVRLDMYRNGVDLSGEARQCEKVENMKNKKNKKNRTKSRRRCLPAHAAGVELGIKISELGERKRMKI
jgi:hypothetical protein